MVNNLSASSGDIRDSGLIPRSERSPGGGHGNLLYHSFLENPTTEEPGGLQSMGCMELDMTGVT